MNSNPTVAFYTLGCKLNFSETSTIARQIQDDGFTKVAFEEPADLYVINTCSVTENADKQFKQLVRKALQQNPLAFVAAVGCYAQLKPAELAAVDGVDLVLGATEKFNLTAYIHDLTKKETGIIHACEIDDADFYVGSYYEFLLIRLLRLELFYIFLYSCIHNYIDISSISSNLTPQQGQYEVVIISII
jgi:threonylcarbamoyladenosine tRNA methylthiotransferase MtaB